MTARDDLHHLGGDHCGPGRCLALYCCSYACSRGRCPSAIATGLIPPAAVLARVVETCAACPSQWDAWTVDGQYLYLRYRGGIGTVDSYAAPGPNGWDHAPDGEVARFEDRDDPLNGCIELEEFCARAGLTLAPDVVVQAGRKR